jgi:hypothetical protein
MLVFGVFVGCSDDDASIAPDPPEPHVAGSIGVYADIEGTDRNLTDTGGTVTLYVVHKVEDGGTASAFTIEAPEGWALISEISPYPLTIGNITAGISIAYGQCLSEAIHIMTLTYRSPGDSQPGSVFEVKPHPHWPDNITVVDCDHAIVDDGVAISSPVVIPQ